MPRAPTLRPAARPLPTAPSSGRTVTSPPGGAELCVGAETGIPEDTLHRRADEFEPRGI